MILSVILVGLIAAPLALLPVKSYAAWYDLLGIGNFTAEAIQGILDVLGHVVPGALHLLLRPHVEVDLVEHGLQLGEVAPPGGHGLGEVDLQSPQAELQHPLGLVLVGGDLPDDVP